MYKHNNDILIEIELIKWTTGYDYGVVKWVYVSMLFVGIALGAYFIKEAVRKMRGITNPKNNNSYSIISVYIIKMIITNIFLLLIGHSLQIYMIFDKTVLYLDNL